MLKQDDWFKDITDYIEYNYFSFGKPPIEAGLYHSFLIH